MIELLVKLSSHNMVALRNWNYGVIYSIRFAHSAGPGLEEQCIGASRTHKTNHGPQIGINKHVEQERRSLLSAVLSLWARGSTQAQCT